MASASTDKPDDLRFRSRIDHEQTGMCPRTQAQAYATILHQLGIDHRKLTFKFQGLDQRLTGVEEEAQVIRGILS